MARRDWASRGLGVGGFILLATLTALSPLTNVFILPALPELAGDLRTTLAAAQFALSAGFAGLAVGLLVVGPLSDSLGRRAPLTVGLILYVLTTILCAFAPDIQTLVLCRVLQGASGGAVWVITRAVVRDIYPARSSARVFSQLAMITGLAPILAPIISGQLLRFTDWRGLLVALACLGLVVTLMSLVLMSESLPPERRNKGGVRGQTRVMLSLMRSHYFLAFIALGIVQSAMYFSYLIMSPFVFYKDFGLNAQAFGAVFAGAALMMVLGNQLNVLLLRRWTPDRLLRLNLMIALVGSATFFVVNLFHASLPVVIGAVLIVSLSNGASNANITALGLAPFGHAAGSASAVLGAFQFGVGALVPPLVSLVGVNGTTMGLAMVVTALGAWTISMLMRARLRAVITDVLAGDEIGQGERSSVSRA